MIQQGMDLLYEANKGNLRSIAVYNGSGSLIAAEPVASQKEDPNVTRQGWYIQAMEKMENMHFPRLISRTCLTTARSVIIG